MSESASQARCAQCGGGEQIARDRRLLKRVQKLQAKKMNITQIVHSPHFGHYWGSFTGDEAGQRSGRGRDGEMDHLLRVKSMCRSDASSASTDIECFRELNELCPGGVRAPQKHRDLDAQAG